MTWITVRKIYKRMGVLDMVLIFLLCLGVIVSAISLFRGITAGRQVQIEYLNGSSDPSDSTAEQIFVDIEGAVMTPGVYGLPVTGRVKDLLVLAGGFSEEADRSYCEKNLNMAQLLKDGQKIYIPEKTDTPVGGGYIEAKSGIKMINVNTATVSELDTLWGVGPARSETIVKNRPYANMEELVSKGGMTKQIFEKNKEVVTLF